MSTGDLHRAIDGNDWNESRILLSSKNAQSLVEYTVERENALDKALQNYQVPNDIIRSMLAVFPRDQLFKQDKRGWTLLYKAIVNAHTEEIVLSFLDKCPQAAFIPDDKGNTPLISAIDDSSPNIIRRLLSIHPDALTVANKTDDIPLHLFFHTWNLKLRKEFKSIEKNDHSVRNAIVEVIEYGRTSGRKITIDEVYQITLLVLKAATFRINENAEMPFQSLHAAIVVPPCPWSFFSLILRLDPKQAYLYDKEGKLPIHTALTTKSSHDGNIHMCSTCQYYCEELWYWYEELGIVCPECLEEEEEHKDKYVGINAIDKIPTIIKELLETNHKFARIPNRDGKLPLHIAIEHGKYFEEDGMKAIFKAAPESLSTRDIVTHMYPFMLSAVGNGKQIERKKGKPSHDLLKKFTACFDFLLENPVLVQSGIPKSFE